MHGARALGAQVLDFLSDLSVLQDMGYSRQISAEVRAARLIAPAFGATVCT